MSLSEPRKRRKNPMHSINLSAQNHWSNDDSKFGQRMLEKFGWSKGSGLGKNKQGISENIRVQHKVVPTGLGFVAHNADDWFKAGEDYSRLLSQLTEKFDQYKALSEEVDNTTSKKSLVQNSLNSKSRVHYHKFTKGKDLTQYKSEELACILGKGLKDDDQSSNSLNMIEYFKTKRESKKFKTNKSDSSSNDDSIVIDEEVNEKSIIQKEPSEHEINNVPLKKNKHELKLSKDFGHIESNECNNIQLKEKKKKKSKVVIDDVNDIEKTKTKKLKELHTQDAFDVKQLKQEKSNDISSEELDHTEQFKNKKKKEKIIVSDNLNGEESLKCEYNNNAKIEKDQDRSEPEFVLTHKHKNLVDLLIENSSAGKKYYKDSPSPLFEKKMQEFENGIKLQCTTTNSFDEVKPADEKSTYEPIILNPDDENFVKDFEAHKSKVLENISKKQEVAKYINEKSMFIAKHGDVLFFGSNINDIKGYGNW